MRLYRVFSKGRIDVGPPKSLIFWTFPGVLGFFWPFNMGDFSFWYFWGIWLKKKLKNLILKKSKISGLAQIGSISAVWVFGVANFGFHYLRHFSINFENSYAHLVANFLNFLKLTQHFEFVWFWRMLWTKTKKMEIRKYANLSQPWNLTFFEDETIQVFFSIICPKSTRMKNRPYWMVKKSPKHQEKSKKWVI